MLPRGKAPQRPPTTTLRDGQPMLTPSRHAIPACRGTPEIDLLAGRSTIVPNDYDRQPRTIRIWHLSPSKLRKTAEALRKPTKGVMAKLTQSSPHLRVA